MNRSNTLVNFITLFLLLIVAAGSLFMPRYNYGVMESGMKDLMRRTVALEVGFAKVDLLAGEDREKRSAVVTNIDQIASRLAKSDIDMVAFLEQLSLQGIAIEEVDRRVGSLERHAAAFHHASKVKDGDSEEHDVQTNRRNAVWTENNQKLLVPQIVAEMDFDTFLGEAYVGLVAAGTTQDAAQGARHPLISGGGVIDDAQKGRIRLLFESFKTCVESLGQSEQVLIETLVEKATKRGEYFEETDRDAENERKPVDALPQGTTVYVIPLHDGKRRVFHLKTADLPEFMRIEDLRKSALKSLLAAIAATSGT